MNGRDFAHDQAVIQLSQESHAECNRFLLHKMVQNVIKKKKEISMAKKIGLI